MVGEDRHFSFLGVLFSCHQSYVNKLLLIGRTDSGEGNESSGHAGGLVPRVGAHDARRAGGVARARAVLALVGARALQRHAQRARHCASPARRQQGPHNGQLLHLIPHL